MNKYNQEWIQRWLYDKRERIRKEKDSLEWIAKRIFEKETTKQLMKRRNAQYKDKGVFLFNDDDNNPVYVPGKLLLQELSKREEHVDSKTESKKIRHLMAKHKMTRKELMKHKRFRKEVYDS